MSIALAHSFGQYPPFSAGGFSDSEGEFDNEDAHVTLPQRMHGVGNTKSQVCVTCAPVARKAVGAWCI